MRSAGRWCYWICLPLNSLFTISKGFPALVLVVIACSLGGCSGGGASNTSSGTGGETGNADFALIIPAQVTVQSGGLPQSFQIGFGSSQNNLPVTVTISGVGSGLNWYGGSTYKFTDTATTPSYTWEVGAGSGVAAGSSSFSVSATNGSVTHTWTINVTITQAAAFQVNLSPSTITLMPGQSSTVKATVSGSNIPANLSLQVGSYPAGTQYASIASILPTGGNVWNIVVAAPPVAHVSTVSLFVQAYSGAATSNAVGVLNLTVQGFPAVTALTRSNFVRAGDVPWGGVYDAARKLVFVAYGRLNQVVVYSSVDQHVVATIPVGQYQPITHGAQIVDESADGSRVFVGSAGQISIIDPGLLQVVGVERTPTPLTAGAYENPSQLVTLADGNLLVENSDGRVYLWNPATHTFTPDDPPSLPGYSALGTLARSADHSTALLFSSSSGAILFHSGTDSYGASVTNLSSTELALSPDGSQIAAAFSTGGNPQVSVWFYDSQFNVVGVGTQSSAECEAGWTAYPIYSLDGKTVDFFLNRELDGPIGIAFDAQHFNPTGVFAAASPTAVTQPFAIDESGLVFGSSIQRAGLAITDVSDPGAIESDDGASIPFPGLSYPVVAKYNDLSLNASVQNYLSGLGFDANASYGLYVGAPPGAAGSTQASGVSVGSTSQLNFTAPPSTKPGPVNLTLTRSDGWNEVIPDALTYGPDLIAVYPNAIPAAQTANLTAIGYGLAGDGEATVGGSTATVNAANALTLNGLFPLVGVQLTTNSGTPGWADLSITNQTGTTTLHHAVQFLKSVNTYALSGFPSAVAYDKTHQRVYVSNSIDNNVAVFDLASSSYLSAIAVGNGPTSLVLTGDDGMLAVLNADATVSVIDTSQLKVVATWPAVSAAEKSAGVMPSLLTLAAPHSVVVGLMGPYVHLLDLTTGGLSCTGVAGCDSSGIDLNPGVYTGLIASSPDGTKVVFSGGQGTLAVLDLAQNSLSAAPALFTGSNALAVNVDKNTIADALNAYDGELHPLMAIGGDELYYTGGQTATTFTSPTFDVLNASGSLLFVASFVSSGGLVVLDVHHGKVAMRIAPPNGTALSALALDETGTRLFCATQQGLAVIDLYEAPLSIGSVTTGSGPFPTNSGSPGATVTIRGSGFESGTSVRFGTATATTTYVDGMTLQAIVPSSLPSGPVQVTVTNTDGSSYSLDAALAID